MTEFDPSFDIDPIDRVAATVEERIIDLSSPHSRAVHVRRVVQELDEGDTAPLWQTPEQVLRRTDVDNLGESVLDGIVRNWRALRPSMYWSSTVPASEKITNGLIGKSQGRFVHPHLSRFAVSDETVEKYMERQPRADPHSFRQYELSIETQRGTTRTVRSALGLLTFRNEKLFGKTYNPRADVYIVPVVGGSDLQAEIQTSIARAGNRLGRAALRPDQGGLPGLGKNQ